MENVDFCFLILHYRNAIMTEKTVSSILSLSNNNSYKIVIVDNASPDESGELLSKKYRDSSNLYLLRADENGGFSKGNNIGYQFIKENFSPRFLICANNDVLFSQNDFLCRLEKLYAKYPFYVCGPDIYTPWRDYHSNPLSVHISEDIFEKIEKDIEQINNLLLTCTKIFSLKVFKLYLIQKARRYELMQEMYRIIRRFQCKNEYTKMMENVVLSGACLIFDKRFIDESDKLFEPETFLYYEEYILSLRCQRKHWNVIYFPEICVDHLHEGNSDLANLNYKDFCKYLHKKAIYLKDALMVLKYYAEEGNK